MSQKLYKPKPLDTSKVIVTADLQELIESLAANTHDVWAQQRMADGWTYGPQRDDAQKHNPCLVPYEQLSEKEKEYDRATAMQTIKALISMGYRIVKG
jgi:hypothetical protein